MMDAEEAGSRLYVLQGRLSAFNELASFLELQAKRLVAAPDACKVQILVENAKELSHWGREAAAECLGELQLLAGEFGVKLPEVPE